MNRIQSAITNYPVKEFRQANRLIVTVLVISGAGWLAVDTAMLIMVADPIVQQFLVPVRSLAITGIIAVIGVHVLYRRYIRATAIGCALVAADLMVTYIVPIQEQFALASVLDLLLVVAFILIVTRIAGLWPLEKAEQ